MPELDAAGMELENDKFAHKSSNQGHVVDSKGNFLERS